MSAEAQNLLEKYQNVSAGGDDICAAKKPNWGQYSATAQCASALNSLDEGSKNFNKDSLQACMTALQIQGDPAPAQYVVTLLYDILRSDAGVYQVFEESMLSNPQAVAPLARLIEGGKSQDAQQTYVADKAAWIMSSMNAHVSNKVKSSVSPGLLPCCSDLGNLEAIVNYLKSENYRAAIWNAQGVQSLVFKMNAKSSSAMMYKGVFAIWMASFDESLAQSLRNNRVAEKLKDILSACRTEKVIRLCLTVLKQFLSNKATFKAIIEDMVEGGLLDVVQNLEYEKWRDAELYDDIKDVSQMISAEVKEMSNFDRYMKELNSGNLSWGFIHSSKFFGENIMKFEKDDFKAVKMLAQLLSHDSNTTLAVACHDIGQFVSLHPMGKKKVASMGVKERVMELMGSGDADKREVRREALLCCQKLMLNKWQDAAGSAEKK